MLLLVSGSLLPDGANLRGVLSLSTDHVLADGFSVNIGRQRTRFFAGRTVLHDSYSRSIVFPAQLAALVKDKPVTTAVSIALLEDGRIPGTISMVPTKRR